MRTELYTELKKIANKYQETYLALLKHPDATWEHKERLHRIRRELQAKAYEKHSDDLQKLNNGESLRIKK